MISGTLVKVTNSIIDDVLLKYKTYGEKSICINLINGSIYYIENNQLQFIVWANDSEVTINNDDLKNRLDEIERRNHNKI